jgi:Uma2 family endonuclease
LETVLDSDLIAPERPRRLTRAQYDAIVAAGLFSDEHVELIEGVVVSMSPNDPAHASPVQLLTQILVPPLAGRAAVRVQLPIVAADESEPEPDVAIVPLADYASEHPASALLVIEVADSSIRKDRLVKAPLYAKSGFREYWLVNVRTKTVEVHRGPSQDGWASITRLGVGETLYPEAFPDVAVEIGAILR